MTQKVKIVKIHNFYGRGGVIDTPPGVEKSLHPLNDAVTAVQGLSLNIIDSSPIVLNRALIRQ